MQLRYIKICEHNETFLEMLKSGDVSDLVQMIAGHKEWLKGLKAEGKLIDAYFLPGDGRCIMIFEFNDNKDVDKVFLDDPLAITFDGTIHPAVPLSDHIADALKENI